MTQTGLISHVVVDPPLLDIFSFVAQQNHLKRLTFFAVFNRRTVVFLHGPQITNIKHQPQILWFLQPNHICVTPHQFCTRAALSLILSCNNAQ